MLTAAAILLFLLPLQVTALITANAKCIAGYDWMYSSIGQSPCDVAAELASVCIAMPYALDPLPGGYVYAGPTKEDQSICKCNSVYYSMLSGCAYCQQGDYRLWSFYSYNCSAIYLTVFPEQLPVGVKVPAYAYLDVTVSDGFNATLASRVTGVESSRPPSSTQTPTTSGLPSSTATPGRNNTAAIVGGVVGGVLGLGLIAALITFLVLRSKKKAQPQGYNSNSQQSPNMASTPNTTASLLQHTSPHPGSPGMVTPNSTSLLQSTVFPPHGSGMLYNPGDPSTYPSAVPNLYDPHSQHSPFMNQNPTSNLTGNSFHNETVTSNHTGNSAQNYVPPQMMPMPQTSGPQYYSGVPEL